MPTGLLIRDFVKDYRELRYTTDGSIAFSDIEINAYRMALTLEVTNLAGPRYGSKKTFPDNTHYGYVTTFKGSTVQETIPIKYPKQRVFDTINQGLWNYHQATESLKLSTAIAAATAESTGQQTVTALDGAGGAVCAVVRFLDTALGTAESPWVVKLLGCGETDPTASNDVADRYRAFPVASPFPSLCKFKGDTPLSFLWRLELWYLVDPTVYVLDNPTDGGDETEDEDEYPTPGGGGGGGGGGNGFPAESPAGAGRDPKDYGSDGGAGIDPLLTYTWTGTISGTLLASNPARADSYSNPISFTAAGNQSPFTAAGDRDEIINFLGESWSAGVTVYDRFGQVVFVFAPNVGFRRGAHTVNVLPSV